MTDLIETLRWLVDTPSVTGDEGRLCTQIAARLLPTYREPEMERIGNSLVVGRRTGRPLVLVVGHIDTVPEQGQGPARIENGRMHGLGTTDMKSGVAVMIHLLEGWTPGPFDLIGVFYDAEEGPSDQNGLEKVLRRVSWLGEAAFAVVLEPTDREIQMGCNGVLNADVHFDGVSAHSARPWLGENAITKAGTFLSEMHDRPPEQVLIADLEFREVMSVTRAAGGVANNVIPDSFVANVNYRFSPLRSLEQAEAVLRDVCRGADRVDITDRAPSGPVDIEHPLVSRLSEVSGAPLTAKQGWTDVARLGSIGIPAINFGPGETALAHRRDESVRLDDLGLVYDGLVAALSEDAV